MRGLGSLAGAAAVCALVAVCPTGAPSTSPSPTAAVSRAAALAARAATVAGRATSASALHDRLFFGLPGGLVHNENESSNNWSGYAVQTKAGRRFTDVVGTWVEPKVTCAGTGNSFAAFWVGIDGYASSSVEQLGTDSDCEDGTASYFAWWEMYPAAAVQLSSTQFPLVAGDTVTGRVSVAHGRFTLTLTSSSGWRFSRSMPSARSYKESSAEWIAEAPVIGTSIARLAPFARLAFSHCAAATDNSSAVSISAFVARQPHDINMVTAGGRAEATASGLRAAGHSFAVTWHRS